MTREVAAMHGRMRVGGLNLRRIRVRRVRNGSPLMPELTAPTSAVLSRRKTRPPTFSTPCQDACGSKFQSSL